MNAALYLKKQGKEYRNLKLYGQELNLITSAIARMNMFMHAIDEFLIVQGDTLDQPQILENDELKQFDVVMANPPYSVNYLFQLHLSVPKKARKKRYSPLYFLDIDMKRASLKNGIGLNNVLEKIKD